MLLSWRSLFRVSSINCSYFYNACRLHHIPLFRVSSINCSYFYNACRLHHIPLILCKFFASSMSRSDLLCRAPLLQMLPLANSEALISALVAAVRSCNFVCYCRGIHARAMKSVNYRDGFIGDQLAFRYVKLGYPEDAQKLFDEILHRDVISWNSLISGFSQSGYLETCLKIICLMKFETMIKPNDVTIISVVSACTDTKSLEAGKYVHGFSLKSGLILYAKVSNSLINMYGRLDCFDEACNLFYAMPVPNIVSWNSIIAVSTKSGLADEGLASFNQMRKDGIEPDEGTMLVLFQVCESLGIRELAEGIHGLIFRYGLHDKVEIATALLDIYAKLGRLNASEKVFREITYPDRVAWTAMLAGYAVHGIGKEAIELFESMVLQGLKPDHVVFTHLLNGCSHSGLVKEGRQYFKLMFEVYGVAPRVDHYSCMVDLLGRRGLLKEAYELIKSMPMDPNSAVWGALLGACKVHKNVELGEKVAEYLFDMDPSDARNYIMLSNIYSSCHLWNDASKVRGLMKNRGVLRKTGCSFIEHESKIYRFVVGDQSHPDSNKIYTKLEEVMTKIRGAGFELKTEFIHQDVDEEVKEDMINKHSEKLAIAFGLLVSNVKTPLVITKNLRICGDCHSTAKGISLIEKRTIIIRDTKRFHHFSNGLCSCRDYW